MRRSLASLASLASVASVASVASLGLAGCASSPAPAAGIGSRSTQGERPARDSAAIIAALPAAASSEWDDAVAAELRQAFDEDGSGRLDRTAEVRAVTCDVWRALDVAVDGSDEYPDNGVAVIYGFTTDKVWVGNAFGIAEKLRPVVADAARACGLELEGPTDFDPRTNYDLLPETEGDRERAAGG